MKIRFPGDNHSQLTALLLVVLLLAPSLRAQDVHAAGAVLPGHVVSPEGSAVAGTGCQSDWVPTFGQLPGAPGGVSAMHVFDSGDGPELWASTSGGGIGAVNGNLGRWNGSEWRMHVANGVRAFATLDDGPDSLLFVGGNFLSVDGVSANFKRVAQWDGTSWSSLGPGLPSLVEAMAVFDDGSGPALYVATNNAKLHRWDGASWSTVVNNSPMQSLLVFDDGAGPALYAGGSFTAISGVPANRVARWDGSSWSALGDGLGDDSPFWQFTAALVAFDDGSGPALYAGGAFGGLAQDFVARWDGASWSSLGSGVNGHVYDLAVFDDGAGPALFVGGKFSSAGGQEANYVARWNGTRWSNVDGGVADAVYAGPERVNALTSYDDGNGPRLYVGGTFDGADGLPGTEGLCTWDGVSYGTLGEGLTGLVRAVVSHDDGSGPALYVAGEFTAAGEVPLAHIGRWDGSTWSDVGGGLDGDVWALHVHDDGSGPALYAGGNFSMAGGVGASRVARWDGTAWSRLGEGVSCESDNDHNLICVRALATFDDGEGPALVAGGDFRSAGSSTANGIAQWRDGSWRALEVGTDFNRIKALAVFDDGGGSDLYVGGNFSLMGGVAASRIARWDGASWSSVGGGVNSGIYALTVWDDGTGAALYAGGNFTEADGVTADAIARWDGAGWSAVGDLGLGIVWALAAFEDASGSYLVAGHRHWDGSSWTPQGTFGAVNSVILALATHDAGSGRELYVGGSFTLAGGSSFYPTAEGDSFLARWGGCSPGPSPWVDLGGGTSGVAGVPKLAMSGPLTPLSELTLDLLDGPSSALALLFVSFTSSPVGYVGGTLHTFPYDELLVLSTDPAGELHGSTVLPSGIPPGQELWFQLALDDSVPIFDTSLSNGVRGTVP